MKNISLLRIIETFVSIDGEVNQWGQGYPSMFIRLAGCNLSCFYCDTPKSRDMNNARVIPITDLVQMVKDTGVNKVTITGGEPFLQIQAVANFIGHLPLGTKVSIETNGTIDISNNLVHWPAGQQVNLVMDYKIRYDNGSILLDTVTLNNLIRLQNTEHWVKFVVSSREEYEHARQALSSITCRKALSPVIPILGVATLWQWMQEDKLYDVTLNTQLHKLIGFA